ncbi:MAG: amino acid ABC transporter permease [Lachnospiraceae bacterium]|nr:amino acid ABC transporter permease [Lachnospiraceae bacterium]
MDLLGVLKDAYPTLLKGLLTTVEVTLISLLIATVLGIITCLFRISKVPPLKWLARFYIWLIRDTPMLVQAMYIYLALPQLIQLVSGSGFKISIMTASIATLALNAGAYMSEIFRGAIEAVDRGQTEAARSLGLNYSQTMRKVVLPQAVRICLPSLVNQCIITLKDSTILYAIGLAEIMYYGKVYVGRTFAVFATYTWIAVFFLAVVSVLSFFSRKIEKKLKS